jgi:F-type H+-transporting ATPase subunit delta
MPQQSVTSPIAITYARSLLDLANEQQQAEAVGQEMSDLRQLVADHPGFAEILANPGVAEAERRALLGRVFQGRVSPLVWNFLGVLNAKGRLGLLGQMADAYADLLDEQLGKVEVDVTVARRLEADQLEQLGRRVGQALGRNAVVHQYVDESIIGGLVLRVQDQLIDASVRSQLDSLRERLLAARPR